MPDAVETGAYVKRSEADVPWHKLGTALPPGLQDSKSMMEAGGLDWEVEVAPLWIPSITDPNEYSEVEYNAVRRVTDGTIFGYVGGRYDPLQNRDAFAFMDKFFQDGTLQYECVWALHGGSVVVLVASVGDTIRIGPEDEIKPYVFLMNGHDGKTGVLLKECATRIVCANTLNIARSEQSTEFKFRHTSSLQTRIEQAGNSLAFVKKHFQAQKDKFEEWADSKLEEETWNKIVVTLAPDDPEASDRVKHAMMFNRQKLQDVYEKSPSVDRGTKWGAFNAAAEFIDWYEPRKGMTLGKAPDMNVAIEKRAIYSTMGKGAEMRQKIASILG